MIGRLFPVSRWLVVDDSPEDAADLALAIEGLGGKADTADSIKAAERLLKKNIYDVCIIDCFYKGSTRWGIDLLPELRATLPGLPVVMTSSSDDLDLPGRVIRAGADVFCPKLKDSLALTKTLGALALQAIAIRKLKILEFAPRENIELYRTKAVNDALEHSIKRKEERLLICGAAGTGKTKIANFFAYEFLKHNFGSISRNVVYFNCASQPEEAVSQMLFGYGEAPPIPPSSATLRLTLFERAVGGVLILDDIHTLSKEQQYQLKHIFDNEMIPSTRGETSLPLNLIKFVVTCSHDVNTSIVPGFLEAFAHREIELPTLSDLSPDLDKIIPILFERFFGTQQDVTITYASDVITKVLDLISHYTFPANFRTLHHILHNAISKAIADGRSQIYTNDIEFLGLQRAPAQRVPPQSGVHPHDADGLLETRAGEQLIRCIRHGENFDYAKDLLRKLMIQMASKKHGGNKSKMASALGISRQSLYDHENMDTKEDI